MGYAICIDKAGRYSEDEARSICDGAGVCIAVDLASVEPLARSTPYYRKSNGTLAVLYDGGPHRPVPNSSEAWRHLLNSRLPTGRMIEKPTPIALRKARSIYLDGIAIKGWV